MRAGTLSALLIVYSQDLEPGLAYGWCSIHLSTNDELVWKWLNQGLRTIGGHLSALLLTLKLEEAISLLGCPKQKLFTLTQSQKQST